MKVRMYVCMNALCMHVCMHACMQVGTSTKRIYIYTRMYTYTCTHMSLSVRGFSRRCTYVHVCTRICTNVLACSCRSMSKYVEQVCTSMYKYMYKYVRVCGSMYKVLFTSISMRTYVRMYVCTYVRMYVRMHVCMSVRMYVCTYVRMYVSTYVRMYVCMNRLSVCMYACT